MPIGDLPGYYPIIKEGGLGVMPPSLAGLFSIVGTSEQGTTDVKFVADAGDVLDEYGFGSILTIREKMLDSIYDFEPRRGFVLKTASLTK